ncbi:hypothetical protein [Alteromonas sp. P256]|uniref:hypothetical protein n=1 Tax=Alteromonas sp. P256 TaxID=3117399 RepID=UPI002FE0CCEB
MTPVDSFADFICELDKLKAVKRKITLPADKNRNAHLKTCAPALWDFVSRQLDIAVANKWLLDSPNS